MQEKESLKISRIKIVLFHVAAWILYQIPFFLLGMNSQLNMSVPHYVLWTLDNLIFDLGIFYFFYLFVIPNLLEKQKYSMFFMYVGLTLLTYPFAKYYTDLLVHGWFEGETVPINNEFPIYKWQTFWFRLLAPIFLISMSGMARFTIDWFKNIKWKAEIENQRLSSELDFLKSQMNPHFLFNTLNNIYTLAYTGSALTAEAILKLSELMRYLLYESNEKEVVLSKEIDHLNAYVDLYRLKVGKSDKIQVQMPSSKAVSHYAIAPLLLSPFIENALKHSNAKDEIPIKIKLEVKDSEVAFWVSNGVSNHDSKDEIGGVGLKNVKRRLELLYPKQHELRIETSNQLYKIALTIVL